jgi:hypothetical protein
MQATRGTLCVSVCVASRMGEEGKIEGGQSDENGARPGLNGLFE